MKIKDFITNAPIGKIIKVRFKDGKNYELVKYHEGIIGTKDCPFSSRMNEDLNKKARWGTSKLKRKLEKWFKENAPEELVEICDVTIPSMTNVYGEEYKKYHRDDKNQFQFAYFKDWHNRIKTILTQSSNNEGWPPQYYWTKSPVAGCDNSFSLVYDNGKDAICLNAYNDFGVAPVFILKKEGIKMGNVKLTQDSYNKLLNYAKRQGLNNAVKYLTTERASIVNYRKVRLGERDSLLQELIDMQAICFLRAVYFLLYNKTLSMWLEEDKEKLAEVWPLFNKKELLLNYDQETIAEEQITREDVQYNFGYIYNIIQKIATEHNYKIITREQLQNLKIKISEFRTNIVCITAGNQGRRSHYEIEILRSVDWSNSGELFIIPLNLLEDCD